jgi:hypothetical protein
MDTNKADIKVRIIEDECLISLRWYRGASRYNNGATRFGNKYIMRFIIARAKESAVKSRKVQNIP